MKTSLSLILALILIAALTPRQSAASSQDSIQSITAEDEHDHSAEGEEEVEGDDDPVPRVARISFLDGSVSFLRAGVTEWADAVVNLPLFTGDQVFVGSSSRAEIQLGRDNYVRLSENTTVGIAELSHTMAQLEMTEGTAIIRLERFGSAFERFEIDTPNAAMLLEQDGLYRIQVSGSNISEVIVRRGAAEVTTADGSFRLREGYRLNIDSAPGGRLEVAADTSRDDWDAWSYDRDNAIDTVAAAAAPEPITTHERQFNCFYGASELSQFGTWTSLSPYGYCWLPRVAAGWSPYRYGQWIWVPRAGWTWLSSEPWGWAPYHYGRWVYLSRLGWAWVPGIGSRYAYGHRYYQWRPALVYFFNYGGPSGRYIGWYPLRPGERWRRPDRQRRNNNHARNRHPGPKERPRRPDDRPGPGRPGTSVMPVHGFTRSGPQPAAPDAPARDITRWLAENGQPGLPDGNPSPDASKPNRSDRGGATPAQPAVRPTAEVASRPVVTRNRPSETAPSVSPRERNLVFPRKLLDGIGPSAGSGKGQAFVDGSGSPDRAGSAWSSNPGNDSSPKGPSLTPRTQRQRPTRPGDSLASTDSNDRGASTKPKSSERRGRIRVDPGADAPDIRRPRNSESRAAEGTPRRVPAPRTAEPNQARPRAQAPGNTRNQGEPRAARPTPQERQASRETRRPDSAPRRQQHRNK